MRDSPLLRDSEARCSGSDSLETQGRMALWRPWVRHDIITAGEPEFLTLVDDGMENLTPADSADALQIFTLPHS
ncbi:MAG: hypothetical protein NTY98_20790 [Verrucomicrobia bacterium]|nr:hypothetical protein [Verrucomicrobiota bacterium]